MPPAWKNQTQKVRFGHMFPARHGFRLPGVRFMPCRKPALRINSRFVKSHPFRPVIVKIREAHHHRPVLSQLGLAVCAAIMLSQCSSGPSPKLHTDVVVSVKEQKLAIYNKNGAVAREYPVSTSKFGLSDNPGTYGTPLGLHEVVAKIGHGAPSGAVFKSRHWTGEVIKPDSPGRDPIVSRIMWLRGMERTNKNAYARCIYIHGTAEERNIGKPVSYGCIRMKSRDVIDLFERLPIGSRVLVTQTALPASVPTLPAAAPTQPAPGNQPPIFLNPQQQPSQPQLVAQNTTAASSGTSPSPEPVPSRRQQSQQSQGGGAILYTAPTGATSGMVLKSRRTASQAIQN